MANLKNITDLPVAESAEGLNLIVNDNGSAKQIAASAVGAQADWAVTDENSPAFIKNKPVEEWDLDLSMNITWNTETNSPNDPVFTAAEGYSYETFVAKIEAGNIPKVRFRGSQAIGDGVAMLAMADHCSIGLDPEIGYAIIAWTIQPLCILLNEDNTFTLD